MKPPSEVVLERGAPFLWIGLELEFDRGLEGDKSFRQKGEFRESSGLVGEAARPPEVPSLVEVMNLRARPWRSL